MLKLGLLQYRIAGPPEVWKRVHRYASWMRRISVGCRKVLGEAAIRQFRLNSPADGWFPALRVLDWVITEHNLPYIDLVLSPSLEAITISTPPWWILPRFTRSILPALTPIFSVLPAPTLQTLHFSTDNHDIPWEDLKNSFSSVVLRCGPSLTTLVSSVPLSDAAVDHTIRLPHISTWVVEGPPPNHSPSYSPTVFPPLTQFGLGVTAGYGWLSLFQRLEDHVSTTQSMTPLYRVKESLKSLSVGYSSAIPIVDISLISPIRIFRNLATLDVATSYYHGQCTFGLNNNDITELVMALPQPERLHLRSPCQENTCATSVVCLLQISVRCHKLGILSIHFNTTNIVDDLKNIPVDPQLQELCSLPRCTLPFFEAHGMPLTIDESDFKTVVDGMRDIFPSLGFCTPLEGTWDGLARRIEELQRT